MGWLRDWKRKRVLARHAVDDSLWHVVTGSLPYLRGLSQAEEQKLKDMAVLFLAEKQVTPLGGVTLSDPDRLSIAIQACLPVLELGLDWYEGWVGILVYPGDFRVRHEEMDENGVLHEWEDELAGESWEGGPVILSWDAVSESGRVAEGGANVVIHEFAHKLDMKDGEADGTPPLHAHMDPAHWHAALEEAYVGFCDAVDRDKDTWLDPYASENPAEFFAVASEAFFEAPWELKRRYPDLYSQFTLFYRQDPAERLPAPYE
jgi:Mlc titration factor MtfA (ptsG expression regulator)